MHIGIITCEMLRREIKEVIEKAGVDKLFLVLPETSNPAINALSRRVNKRFLSELATGDLKIKEKAIEKIESKIHENNIRDSMIIEVMELRMHDCPDKLLAEVEGCIRKTSAIVDFVLLGYGLCGSTVGEIEKIIKEADVPVVIPRDGKGEILNNCIEIALGRKRVQSLLQAEGGTFFMTPAGASIIKEPQIILESTIGIIAGKMNRSAAIDTPKIIKLMKNHYRRVVKVCYSEADEKDKEYSKTVENFAKVFGLEIKTERGSSKLILDALQRGFDSVHKSNLYL
uniref:DUF1638 domain-containing protein n=1 Tax=Candidatus Methanophaga sp. ANME-1 ERB7 TaxID=2759913 RepID=A0A7G9ZAE6_9EURY|nr:hypothetical protein ALKFPMEL_00012 [Methanosarcinales archaeon ANME-1 ERB7]